MTNLSLGSSLTFNVTVPMTRVNNSDTFDEQNHFFIQSPSRSPEKIYIPIDFNTQEEMRKILLTFKTNAFIMNTLNIIFLIQVNQAVLTKVSFLK